MQSNDIDVQTRMIAEISYAVVCGLLRAVLIGSPPGIALGIAGVVFPIIGALKANKVRQYPFSLQIFCAAKDLHA